MDDRTKWLVVWPAIGFLVAAAFGIGVIAEAAHLTGSDEPATSATATSSQAFDVELTELAIQLGTTTIAPGDATFRVHNAGQAVHNLSFGDLGSTQMLDPGETASLNVSFLAPGIYDYLCEVPGHADAGMKGTLVVGAGSAASPGGHDTGSMTPEEMIAHDAEVTGSFPAETKGRGGQDLVPQVTPDGVRVFRVTAAPIQWETEPGEMIEAWAYNGMVPGPTIRATLGDRVRIVLTNELPEPTTIHYHGLTVPADMDGVPVISQRAVLPGETFTYEFTVRNTGSHMYHSHFNAQKQVPMGLLGAFIVPDPDDPPAAVDYTMILNDGPLGYTLNGKGFPATEPLSVPRDQTIRIRYMNEGLQIHPMHLHGLGQEIIAIDGVLLDQPYAADTVLIAPGQRIDVLVRATEPGVWAWHCHVLNHAESEEGMFGMVTALIVEH